MIDSFIKKIGVNLSSVSGTCSSGVFYYIVVLVQQVKTFLFRIFRIMGTPTESNWPGVSSLPDYKPVFPKWEPPNNIYSILPQDLRPGGHDLLVQLLTYNPENRISAKKALSHPYLSNVSCVTPPSCWGEWSGMLLAELDRIWFLGKGRLF